MRALPDHSLIFPQTYTYTGAKYAGTPVQPRKVARFKIGHTPQKFPAISVKKGGHLLLQRISRAVTPRHHIKICSKMQAFLQNLFEHSFICCACTLKIRPHPLASAVFF